MASVSSSSPNAFAETGRSGQAGSRGSACLGLAVTPTFLIGRDVGGAVRVEQILTGVRDVDVFIGAIESVLNDRASSRRAFLRPSLRV
jgi:hypothetical protein